MRIRRLGPNRYQVSRTVGRRGRNWSRVVSRAGLAAVVRRLVLGRTSCNKRSLARLDGRYATSGVGPAPGRRPVGVTGAVIVRVGKPRSIISNLHGGGQPWSCRALQRIFAHRPELAARVEADLERLAIQVIEG